MEPSLKNYLKVNEIEFKEHKHKPLFKVSDSRELKKKIPGVPTKNLFLKDDKNNFYLICMHADKRADLKKIRKDLNVRKLYFGSPEDLKEHLKLTPGSVSIFGMIHSEKVTLLIDKEIWNAEITGFHPNINTSTLEIDRGSLRKFINSLKCEKRIIEIE